MNIGFTYDLADDYLKNGYSIEDVAEFDTIETIDEIEKSILKTGNSVDRIGNISALVKRIHLGDRWDLVFNIAEGVSGIAREAQVPALLDAFKIPYVFSDPLVLALTLHKAFAKRIVRDNGLKTPDFMVIKTPDDLNFLQLEFPLFVKPLSEGTGKGIGEGSLITNPESLSERCKMLIRKFRQPVLIESYLPGREFTVGITGTGNDASVVGVMEIHFLKHEKNKVYGLHNKKHYEGRMNYSVPEKTMFDACSFLALEVWKALECRDGGRVDLRNNEKGEPGFIEVNPLAGLNPFHSDLPILAKLNGMDYDQLIKEIINSALKRIENYV